MAFFNRTLRSVARTHTQLRSYELDPPDQVVTGPATARRCTRRVAGGGPDLPKTQLGQERTVNARHSRRTRRR